LISADYYKSKADLKVSSLQELVDWPHFKEKGRVIYMRSSAAERIFRDFLNSDGIKNGNNIFLLHGDDETISEATAREISTLGYKIKAVNWLGDASLVEPLPIGLPTVDRLPTNSGNDFELFMSTICEYRLQTNERDILLYANFDITTNVPIRKRALLAGLQLNGSYCPTSRVGLSHNLHILSKSKYVLSPPGAGPDCFRTWEAIYLGAVPIVLRSHWPFSHLELPVLVVDEFAHLEQKIAEYEKEGHVRNESWEDSFLLP